MKTLNSLLIAFFLFGASQAQFSENFDQNTSTLPGNCWVLNQINYTTTSGDVINGTGSAYTNPPTSSTGERTIETPFLDVNAASLNVSFNYKTSSKISGNATRTLEIGLEDSSGVFTSLQTIVMDKNTPTTVETLNSTYSITTLGTYRLVIKIGGATGDGNSRVIFDDLYTSASAHYGPTSNCNPAAVAVNDSYTSGTLAPVSGNVLLNDNIPADNDVYTPVIVSAPSSGTLILNNDGSFTYTPAVGFTGGTITFSYQVKDNGYTATTSNIAMVTLNFPAPVVLPLKLIGFSAVTEGSMVKISWKVDENETGNYFEIEKSTDGKNFISIAKINVQQVSGIREYSSVDQSSASDVYYRLKMVNQDATVTYSKVVVIKAGSASADVQVLSNPATSNLNISYQSAKEANSTIRVYSITGVKMLEQKVNASKGINKLSIPVQSLQSGTYVVMIDTAQSKKFIKQ